MATMSIPDFASSDATHHTVFIDTSMDTHLAMVVSDGDTVSVLKDKIEKEHPLCFPHLGNIKINALKVKRKGYFYHLSDSMYLRSAFVGVNKSWFLYIDASNADDHSTDPNTCNLLTYFGMTNHTSVNGINLSRNSHPGQTPTDDAPPPLPENAAQQFVDDKAPSEKDLIDMKAELLTHSVENCSKVQLGRTGNGLEDHNEPLGSLPAEKVHHKSKKRKTKLMNEHRVDNNSMDDNDAQNPLPEDIESHEKFRDFDCGVSDLPMTGGKSIADKPCREVFSNDPTNVQKSVCTPEDATDGQNKHLACVTGQTSVTLEDKESMQNADTKASMVENCQISRWDGTDINTKTTQHSELQQLKVTAKNTQRSKKKKAKKYKDSAEGSQTNLVATSARESAQGISATELHSVEGNNSSSKAEMRVINISLMKGENTESAFPTVENIVIDETNNGKVEPLLQMNKTQAGAENVDEQVRKELKKQLVTSTKSMSDHQANSTDNESLPSRINREVKYVSKRAKKTKFPKVKSKKESEEANLESTKNSEVEGSPPSIQMQSRIVGSSLIPSHASEGDHGERSLEANICSNTCKDAENVDNHVEVSCESNIVGIEEKANQLQPESVEVCVDKLSREKSVNTVLRAKRKKKDHNACSSGTSLSLQNVTKSDENAETDRRQTSNSSALKLKKLSSRDRVKSLPANNCEQNTFKSDRAMVGANALDTSSNSAEKVSEAFSVPRMRSNSKRSKNMVHQNQVGHLVGGRKSFHNGNIDVTRAEQKNLLATSGGIFKDASSGSSGDEDGIADSDASTRSPDNSLSSDFSDGESKADMEQFKNGPVDLERKNIPRRRTRKIGLSSPENMPLDTILRSSSRYKKARLTAAQSQLEDTESQPVDVVPDSQADP